MFNMNWFLVLSAAFFQGIAASSWTIQDGNLELSDVTLYIAREHLSKFSSTVVVAEQSMEPKMNNINTHLLDYLLLHLERTIAVQLYIGTFHNQLWDYYIFIIDSFEAFNAIRLKFPVNFFDRNFYFLIVLTKYTPNFHSVMKRIFTICYQFHVINVNIVLDHPKLGVCMFTYKFFADDECGVIRPILYFRFNRGFEHLKTVFPEKLNNFYGCPIKIACRLLAPVLMFTGNVSNPKPVGQWENLSGLDGVLLKVISEALNFSIELLPITTERIDCLASLVIGSADVAIGGFSGSDPDRWVLSPSRRYHYSPFVYILRGGRLINSLSRLGRPFRAQVWILLAFLLISGKVIVQVLRLMKPSISRFALGDENHTPMLNVVAVLLGGTVSRPSGATFTRYILLLLLFATLIIRSAYQAGLYDAIRMDKFARIPLGFDDLIKWNYEMLLSPEIAQLDMFPKNRTIVVVNGTYAERLKMLEGTRKNYATVTLRENYMYYMGTAYRRGCDLIMTKQTAYLYHSVMFFQKNSIYLTAFNKKLQALTSSGITSYASNALTIEPAMFWRYKQRPPNKALTNQRLKAMYKIYAIMMIMALVAFFLELMSVYSKRLRRFIEWIN